MLIRLAKSITAERSNLPLLGKLSQQSTVKGGIFLDLRIANALVSIPKTPRGE